MKGSLISAYDKDGVKLFTSEIGVNGSTPDEAPRQWIEIAKRNSVLTNASLKFLFSNLGVCAGLKSGQPLV